VIAVVLESGRPERLYTGLSLLVCTAAEGEQARGLASFGALPVLLAEELAADGPERFARSLAELRSTARDLPDLRLWACAAAMETHGIDASALEGSLDGVRSMPRFLRETADARLVVV
jgi:peroxiredoxin family protein